MLKKIKSSFDNEGISGPSEHPTSKFISNSGSDIPDI